VKRKPYLSGLVLALLVLALAAVLVACSGSSDNTTATTFSLLTTESTLSATSSSLADGTGGVTGADVFSTFKSKDPFIQQAQPTTTISTTTTIPVINTTTTIFNTSTTYYTTTSGSNTSTTVRATTTTTVAHLHTLKILSIATVSGAAVVSFRVDSTTYQNKHVGEVVSSTWGQIEVVQISTASKVVTLLHGSETLILGVGQSTFE
jgi:hypothetical protein